MKKILSGLLGILILTVGLFVFVSCTTEPDPYEDLYGTYWLLNMFDFQEEGKAKKDVSYKRVDEVDAILKIPNENIRAYIEELTFAFGDTPTLEIHKDSVKFSDLEFKYEIVNEKSLILKKTSSNTDFPFNSIEIESILYYGEDLKVFQITTTNEIDSINFSVFFYFYEQGYGNDNHKINYVKLETYVKSEELKGLNYYSYRPVYSGWYLFKTTPANESEILIVGNRTTELKKSSGKNNELKLWLNFDEEYFIEVNANSEFDFWVEFNPDIINLGAIKSFSLSARGYMLFEFVPEVSAPYSIIVGDERLYITIFDRYLNNITDYNGLIDNNYRGLEQVAALFKVNSYERYYVEIRNNCDVEIESQVQVNASKPIELNQIDNININKKLCMYYSFTPKFSGKYRFSSTASNSLALYSETLGILKTSNTDFLEYDLIEEQTYYFKVGKDTEGYSEQTIIFKPLEIKFQEDIENQKVYLDTGYTFYLFTAGMDAEYYFETNDLEMEFSIYDFDLNLIIESNESYLNYKTTYYIMFRNTNNISRVIGFNIRIKAQGLPLNENKTILLSSLGYYNFVFIPFARDYYIFTVNAEIEIYSSRDLNRVWNGNGSLRVILGGLSYTSEGTIPNLFPYYIHIKGEPNAEVELKVIFDPSSISLNVGNSISGDISSKYYVYNSASDLEHTIYTYGDFDIKTEIIVYDKNLNEIYRFNNDGHADFNFSFVLGENYYLLVNRISGVGPFGFRVDI